MARSSRTRSSMTLREILSTYKDDIILTFEQADEEFGNKLARNGIISHTDGTNFDDLDGVDPRLKARYLYELVYDHVLKYQQDYLTHRFINLLGQSRFSANFALVLQIEHDVTVIVQDNQIPVLIEVLARCTHKWKEIAIKLELCTSEIEQCGQDSSNQNRLYNVLACWQQKKGDRAYLKDIKSALKSPVVGMSDLAHSLNKKLRKKIRSKIPTLSPSLKNLSVEGHEININVADGKCTLLGAEVPYSEPASYQWMKDGQNLTNDLDYSGVHTDILLIREVRQGLEGKYSCEINFSNRQIQEKYLLCIKYSHLKECLLERYTQQNEVPTDSWPPVGVSTYIELALIDDETVSKINDYSIRGDMDDILKEKEIKKHEELFGRHIEGGLVLVEGRPGSGKTTFTHKLVRDWAKGPHILRGSKLVFLISLRMLNSTGKDKTLSDILEIFYNKKHLKEVPEMIESSYGEGVCFIIDGLDEYHSQGSVITKLLKKSFSSFLYKAMVIVASRPIGTAQLRRSRLATKRIEVLGFSKEKISKYIHKYSLNSGSAAELETYLQTHINVFHMCYLPVHTAMICYIYDQTDEIPNTETKIYEIFTLLTIKRKLERDGSKDAPRSLRELDGTIKKCYVDICKLAFEMTINSTQTINQDRTDVCLSDGNGCDVHSLGLVTVDATAKLFGVEDLYAFLHLTFQEYLAACHIAAQEEDEQTRVIEQHKDKKEMLMVWKFYFGMTKFTEQNKEQINIIMNSILMNDTYRLQYAFESQQTSVCECLLQEGSLTFKDYVFTLIDYHAISFVVSNSKPAINLTLDNCFMSQTGTSSFDSFTFNNIKSVSFTNMKETEFEALFSLLQRIPLIEYLSINQMLSKADISAFEDGSFTLSNVNVLQLKMPLDKEPPHSNSEYLLKRLPFSNLKLVKYSYSSNDNESHHQCLSHLLTSFKYDIEPLTEISEDILCNQNVTFSRVTRFLSLTTLKLINSNMVDSEVHHLLDSGIKYESLSLDVNIITDNGAVLLADLVRQCTDLKCLSLGCNQIGDKGAMALAAVLHGNPGLMELDLQCNAIGDKGAVAVARAVKDFPRKFRLSLCNVYVTAKGAQKVLEYRPTAMTIDTLNVARNIFYKANITAVPQAFHCFSYLHTLHFSDCSYPSVNDWPCKKLLGGLKHCHYLKTLILRYQGIDDTYVEELAYDLHQLCFLEVLNLSNNKIGPLGAAAIAQLMQCCRLVLPQDIFTCLYKKTKTFLLSTYNTTKVTQHRRHTCGLLTLNLSNNRIRAKGAAALACALTCSKLETLDLSSNKIENDGAQALALGIQHCQTIHTVILDNNNIGVSLKGCTNLQRLSLRQYALHDKASSIISELSCCSQLQILDFGSNGIDTSGGAALAQNIKHWKHLKKLNIENTNIGSSAKEIAAELQHCTELHTLNISNNKLPSPELIDVFKSLNKFTSLQILELEGNNFNETTIVALISLVKSLPNIRHLDISDSNIDYHDVRMLTDALKTCKLTLSRVSYGWMRKWPSQENSRKIIIFIKKFE